MRPTAPMFPRSTRRSSILSRPSARKSEPLIQNATVVVGRAEGGHGATVGETGSGQPGCNTVLRVRHLDLDPLRELPCRPAVNGRARGRTDGSIRLRVTAFLMFSLALKGAFSNRSTHVKAAVYIARPGHGSLRGQRELPQHLVRSGGQALQGPQRAYVDYAPIAPPRNCLHPRPGAMRVGVFDEFR